MRKTLSMCLWGLLLALSFLKYVFYFQRFGESLTALWGREVGMGEVLGTHAGTSTGLGWKGMPKGL